MKMQDKYNLLFVAIWVGGIVLIGEHTPWYVTMLVGVPWMIVSLFLSTWIAENTFDKRK